MIKADEFNDTHIQFIFLALIISLQLNAADIVDSIMSIILNAYNDLQKKTISDFEFQQKLSLEVFLNKPAVNRIESRKELLGRYEKAELVSKVYAFEVDSSFDHWQWNIKNKNYIFKRAFFCFVIKIRCTDRSETLALQFLLYDFIALCRCT